MCEEFRKDPAYTRTKRQAKKLEIGVADVQKFKTCLQSVGKEVFAKLGEPQKLFLKMHGLFGSNKDVLARIWFHWVM